MGIIRLLLSLAVVGAHTNSHQLLKFVGGELAVQVFFMISGFYMAMVIGSYETIKEFWISRYLRLYPTYMACALLSLVLVQGVSNYINNIIELPVLAISFLLFANITILLQDVTMFLGVNNGVLSFVKFFTESSPPLHQFLLVPPAWSLGVELSFYALAPFILRKSVRTLVLIVVASWAVRILLVRNGFSGDPWSYRFFPSELSNFIIGSLAYKYYDCNKASIDNKPFRYIAFAYILIFMISFSYLPVGYNEKKFLFIMSMAFLIGHVFSILKASKLDEFIGMLSYPIYICHILVISYFFPLFKIPLPNGGIVLTLICYIVVAGFAVVLYVAIEKPVNAFRRKFKGVRLL